MIELKCTSCGASLEVDGRKVIDDQDVVVVRRGEIVMCDYCGCSFAVGDEIEKAQAFSAFNQRGQTVTGAQNISGSFKSK